MSDGYSTLAADYHWLQAGESVFAVVRRHADGLATRPGARILDCACGIGTDAIALAAGGHSVRASDGSAAMVAEARRRVAAAGVNVPVEVCSWEDLAGSHPQPFDVVLCLGNSISHVGHEGMVSAFRGMAAVLGPGGRLILNARNWEKLRRDRPRLSVPERAVDGQGGRCVPVYLWSFPPDWDEPHHVEIVFVIESGRRVTARSHQLSFWPFRLLDVHRRLEQVGLRVVADTYQPEADWYEVVAEKPL